jgi:hypothetical protein
MRARRHEPLLEGPGGLLVRFPAQAWARRMMGVYANQLANENPAVATGVLVPNADGTLRVSIRVPITSPTTAADLCRGFPTGGGRANAAGINTLPEAELPRFLEAFRYAFDDSRAALL